MLCGDVNDLGHYLFRQWPGALYIEAERKCACFANSISKSTFLYEKCCISIHFLLTVVTNDPIINETAFTQRMARCQTGTSHYPNHCKLSLLTHIYTRPQWVKIVSEINAACCKIFWDTAKNGRTVCFTKSYQHLNHLEINDFEYKNYETCIQKQIMKNVRDDIDKH